MNEVFYPDLIQQVKANDVLYNKRHPDYFNNEQKNICWTEISINLNKSVEECRKRWKFLRERFVKECRKLERPSTTADYVEPWIYLESLTFLKKYVAQRRRCNATSDEFDCTAEVAEEGDYCTKEEEEITSYVANKTNYAEEVSENSISDGSVVPSLITSGKKRRVEDVLQSIEEATSAIKSRSALHRNDTFDVDECFCKTLISLLREFPEDKKDEARTKLFNYIMQLKMEYTSQLKKEVTSYK